MSLLVFFAGVGLLVAGLNLGFFLGATYEARQSDPPERRASSLPLPPWHRSNGHDE